MAERAHPNDTWFADRLAIRWFGGWVPYVVRHRTPYRAAFEARYRWAAGYCRDREVLDIPCGMGWGTSLLRGCRKVNGVDISEEAIAEARQRYGRCADFRMGSMDALDFENEAFDVVCCLEGIEHVPKEVGMRFLAEARRVLRPGGLLLLTSPSSRNGQHSGNPYHVHEYHPEEIREAVEQRFHLEEMRARNVDNLIVQYICARRP